VALNIYHSPYFNILDLRVEAPISKRVMLAAGSPHIIDSRRAVLRKAKLI